MNFYQFGRKFPQTMKQMQRCNALVIGRTGVGKSTLVAALTQTPAQGSRTDRICAKPRQVPNQSFYIYDAPGLEGKSKPNVLVTQINRLSRKLRKQQNRDEIPITELIEDFIQEQTKREPHEQIHVIWYCVGSQFTRDHDLDLKWIHHLSKTSNLPVIAVITRALGQEEGWLTEQLKQAPAIRQIVPVLAQPQVIKGETQAAYGLEAVVKATEDLLEETFEVAVDKAIQNKAKWARRWCQDGCGKVLAAQALPVPQMFKSAAVIPYLQSQSLKKVARIFGYKFDEDLIKRLSDTEIILASAFASIEILAGLSFIVNPGEFMKSVIEQMPGFNADNIETVGLVLEKLRGNIDIWTQNLPIHDTAVAFLGEIGQFSNPIKDIPITACFYAVSETLLTALLLVAWIEVLKEYKRADYEGKPLPDLEKTFPEAIKNLLTVIAQMIWGDGTSMAGA